MLTKEMEQLLAAWHQANVDCTGAKAEIANFTARFADVFERQRQLSEQVAKAFFPTQAEGTSTFPLPNGWALKQVIRCNRKLDAEALESIREPLTAHHVSLDILIRRKPELEVRLYKQLTAEARAIVDTVLTTTPGRPELELVAPKEEKMPELLQAVTASATKEPLVPQGGNAGSAVNVHDAQIIPLRPASKGKKTKVEK